MASPSRDTVLLTCPKCGHRQREPRTAYSTICRNCREHVRLEEVLRPASQPTQPAVRQRRVQCFDCGAELEVAAAAESTMCKHCSSYVDLQDYRISQTISKNFRTYGRLVIEEKGYVLNTDSRVGDAVVKGRLIGRLVAERTLEIHSHASIKGTFGAGCLVIPATQRFTWPEIVRVGAAEIGGEFVANLCAQGTVVLRSTARLFGNVEAANLVVEAGAVFVGRANIGQPPVPPLPQTQLPAAPKPKAGESPGPRPRPKPPRARAMELWTSARTPPAYPARPGA